MTELSSTPDTSRDSATGTDGETGTHCVHCGDPCPPGSPREGELAFCCAGCRTVYELLSEHGLDRFYRLEDRPGLRPVEGDGERFRYLDDESVRRELLEFSDGTTARVTFHIPAIHCVACVWLLENLFQLHPAVGVSRVHFPRKEVSISFREQDVSLSDLVILITRLGYEPEIRLEAMEQKGSDPTARRLFLRLGLAGFAFGNIMLISLPGYFGLDRFSGPAFERFFGWVSLVLALPVLFYSAGDYWRAARLSVQQHRLGIELPIALGLAALFGQSAYIALSGLGPGYFDSFAGLVFFLLCGQVFQRRTYDRLSFDRDYKAYFPLSVTRVDKEGMPVSTPVTRLDVGDRLHLRYGELIPADAVLIRGTALVDYSFVTGESEPVSRQVGDLLYAGGRGVGGLIEVETVKPVSQSYLTSLWDQDVFRKPTLSMSSLTDRISRRFTLVVVGLAVAAGLYWAFADSSLALRSFISVLIVACPCALALAAPFTLGSALRFLGRRHFFLRNAETVEALARVDTVVFDKTGTLTETLAGGAAFDGPPLSAGERSVVAALVHHSTHPHCLRLARRLAGESPLKDVEGLQEVAGSGIEGIADGTRLRLGSRRWLNKMGEGPGEGDDPGATVHLSIDGRWRGAFHLDSRYREGIEQLVETLAGRCRLAVLSGDNDREREVLQGWFGTDAELHFEQSPLDKLQFVRSLQEEGRRVLMVGDGLNDAGALKQSDVGVALTEDVTSFSPACDAILDARRLGRLPRFLEYAHDAVRIIVICFCMSFLYNVLGIAYAARGILSPLLSAVLMPISSVTVVGFAVAAAAWADRRRHRGEGV